MSERDLVRDILERVMSLEAGFTAEMAQQIEADIRRTWGGERVLVAKITAREREQREIERQQIAMEIARGEANYARLAKQHGVSRMKIYRLLKRQV